MRKHYIILALCCASSAFADTITWTGNVNAFWDTNTVNWTPDAGGRDNGLYAEGDHVTFTDAALRKALIVNDAVSPASMLVDSTAEYSFNGNPSFSGGMELRKRGTGTLNLTASGPCNSHTGGIYVAGGKVTTEFHFCGGDVGNGPVFLAGGTWSMNGIRNEGTGRDIYILTNSTLNSQTTMGKDLEFTGPLRSEPGAVLTISRDGQFNTTPKFNTGTWYAQIVDDAASSITIAAGCALEISLGFLVVSTNGRLTESEYPIIDYSSGPLTGLFALETLPSGWTIDYDGTDDNPQSVVLINPNPEPKQILPRPFFLIH